MGHISTVEVRYAETDQMGITATMPSGLKLPELILSRLLAFLIQM